MPVPYPSPEVLSPTATSFAEPLKVPKRIIVCCDGTWQDGIVAKQRWQYSNVLKLSRTLNHEDIRHHPPIPQIVFYQAGIGSERNFYAEYIEGATGASLAEKVQEAYAFIAHNYQSGDEIYLFGFSRGAYTARMCAAFIGEIGVLDRKDMDHFADIFIAFQKRGNADDETEIAECNKILEPFNSPNARGRVRADADLDTFTIKCIGLFDTVGSMGLPEELTFSKKIKKLFGFHDRLLGTHIQHAFHAMALNETRADFDVNKYEQTREGRDKGQVLKQVWFAGSVDPDPYQDPTVTWAEDGHITHDLSDLSLMWMASNIEPMLSLDIEYLCSLPRPAAPWGQQLPHDPRTGIFRLSHSIQRSLPTETNDITHEVIHPSVMFQPAHLPQLEANMKTCPSLLGNLSPLEEHMKTEWPYIPGEHVHHGEEAKSEHESQLSEKKTLLEMAKDAINLKETMVDEGGKPRYEETWLGKIIHELI